MDKFGVEFVPVVVKITGKLVVRVIESGDEVIHWALLLKTLSGPLI